ncbi:hypothetical protein ACNKF0_09520 [Nocardioides sp. T5]|uniref:hypothetical protein n=1 Tax=Nocardioides sp. T5 TaxID=3400182 RepID=UPI003A890FCC
MPRHTRPRRRVNRDKAPWDQLPVIVFHPDPNHLETPMTTEEFNDMVQWLDEHRDDPVDLDRKAVIRNGAVTVVRGPFDVADLPERCLSRMENSPGVEFVVETDGLGRIDVTRCGALVDAEALSIGEQNAGFLQPFSVPKVDKDGTLSEYAQALRDHAARALEVADHYDQLVADGWDLAPEPPHDAWWPPLRRTTAQDES